MIAPAESTQQAAQAEVERIHTDARNGKLTRADYAAYTTLLDLAIYPPDIEERIIREDDPEWGEVRRGPRTFASSADGGNAIPPKSTGYSSLNSWLMRPAQDTRRTAATAIPPRGRWPSRR